VVTFMSPPSRVRPRSPAEEAFKLLLPPRTRSGTGSGKKANVHALPSLDSSSKAGYSPASRAATSPFLRPEELVLDTEEAIPDSYAWADWKHARSSNRR